MFSFIRAHAVGIRAHAVGVAVGTIAIVAGLAWLAFGYFGVHTLFVDDVVDEAGPVFDSPAADAAAPGSAAEPSAPSVTRAPAERQTDEEPVGAPVTGSDVDASATEPAGAPASTSESATATTAPTEPTTTTAPTEPSSPQVVTEYVGTFESDAHPTSGSATVLGNGTGQRFLRFENFETDNGPDLNVYLVDSSTGDVSDYVDLGDLTGNIGDQNYEIPVDVDLAVYDRVVIWCVRFGVGFGDARLMAV